MSTRSEWSGIGGEGGGVVNKNVKKYEAQDVHAARIRQQKSTLVSFPQKEPQY